MPLLRSALFLLFIVSCLPNRSNAVVTVSGVLDIINVSKDIVVALVKAWDLVGDNVDFGEVPVPILHKTEDKLLRRIGIINDKLEDLSGRVEFAASQSIATVQHYILERVRLELRLNDLLDYRTRMDIYHRNMQKYVANQEDYEQLTLEDFASSVISHDPNSVKSLVERIHAFVVPNGKGISNTGLFELVVKGMEFSKRHIYYSEMAALPTNGMSVREHSEQHSEVA